MRRCPYRRVTTIDEKMTIDEVTIGKQVNIDDIDEKITIGEVSR